MQYDLVDGGYLTWLYGSKPFARSSWPPQSVRNALLALDCLDDTFRKRRDATYKANRLGKKFESPELYEQWHRIRELRRDVVEDPRLNCVRISGLEADDIVALAAWYFKKKGGLNLLAQDKDLLQIAGVNITDNQGAVVDLARFSLRLPKAITNQSITRRMIPLILALMGDKSDNIDRIIPRGDLWRMSSILRADNPAAGYREAYKVYGQKFLRNLYAVVLPDPSIFGITMKGVYEMMLDGVWGPELLSELKPEYKNEMKTWKIR